MNDVIQKILERASRPDLPPSAELLPLVYDELRSMAARQMRLEATGQTLQATDLVHEAWLRLTKDGDRSWSDRAHFFRAAAMAMRRILVDRARAKSAAKRGAKAERLDIDKLDLSEAPIDERVLLVNDVIDRLEREDPDSARVISLKFFGGLTNKDIAATDGVTERTVERQWAYAKVRLFQMIRDDRARQP